MDHGSNRASRLTPVSDEDDLRGILTWETVGAWRYALGTFGTIQGYSGLQPWSVRLEGRLAGLYATLEEARKAVERAARSAHYQVTG